MFHNTVKTRVRYFKILYIPNTIVDTINTENNIIVEAQNQAEALRKFNKKMPFKILKDSTKNYYDEPLI
jgi:adenylate kinase